MAIEFYDYVSKYDFVPFAELQKSDDFKVISANKTDLISLHIKKEYTAVSDVKIEFKPEALKKDKTILRFKLQKAHMYASDPDGYLRYKLTTISGQEFVSNHKNMIEHDLGVKKYGDIVEITFSKNLMETVQFIDFYFKDNSDAWFDLKGNLPETWDHCGRVTIGAGSQPSACYCSRDFTEEEVQYFIVQLRKEEKTGAREILRDKNNTKKYAMGEPVLDKDGNKIFVDRTQYDEIGISLFSLNMAEKIQKDDANFTTLTNELNEVLKKYEINTCIRKIHFLAQSYLESQRFMKSYETNPKSTVSGGEHYRGRGLLQLTHDYNYSKFYFNLYNKKPSVDELYDFAPDVSKKLHLATFASGFYWNELNINQYADKDNYIQVSASINYPKALNGEQKAIASINHLTERKMYTNVLKNIFKYEKKCKTKNK